MKRSLAIVLLVVLTVFLFPRAEAQEEPPAWAQQIIDQNNQILSILNSGVVLAPVQGSVQFGQVRISANLDHDGALVVRNNAAGGYGVWAVGGVGLVCDGFTTGAWLVGRSANGATLEGASGWGVNARGNWGALNPDATAAVSDAVWDEPVNEHSANCSTGAALNGRRCRAVY
jgi:hypothetical protein